MSAVPIKMEMDQDHLQTGTNPTVLPDGPTQSVIPGLTTPEQAYPELDDNAGEVVDRESAIEFLKKVQEAARREGALLDRFLEEAEPVLPRILKQAEEARELSKMLREHRQDILQEMEKRRQDRQARLDVIQKEYLDTIQKAQEERDRKILHEHIQDMSPQEKKLCCAMVPIWNKLEREGWMDYEDYRQAIRKLGAPTSMDWNGNLVEVSDNLQKMVWKKQRSAREAMDCFRTARRMPIFKVEDDVV
ncbi:hypothetical protein V8F33_001159 [Rhypophila sp. PSN 637]